jgi:hypothetical protein
VATNSPAGGPGTAWSNAFHVIQDAVDAASPGDTVLVTNGIYGTGGAPRPGLTHINRICATGAITIASVNGPARTIVEGNGARCAYLTNGVTLSGFTLRNSQAASGTCLDEDTSGGVIMTYGGVVISNCIVANGYCYCYGGGIYNNDYDQAVIANCLIKDNESHAYAGGVFYGNLYNCTVVGNHCDLYAGGVAQADVRNCIVVDNTTDGYDPNIRHGTVQYTCTTPKPVGTGNIEAAPSFVDADYRLDWDSPCIDAGNNGAIRGASDLDGSPRQSGATVDMGCYEAPQNAERCLVFDSSGQYAQTPDAADLDTGLGEAFTLEAWFRTASLGDRIIVAKHSGNLAGSYYLAVTAAGNLRFMLLNAVSNRVDHDVAVSYADNRWHHAAAVYDGTNMHLLFDGEPVGGASAQTGRVNNSVYPLRLGCTASGIWSFVGEIDEVRLWQGARSDGAVRDTMHRHLVGSESNLVLCLRLNEVSGGRIRDWADAGRMVQLTGAGRTSSEAVIGSSYVLQHDHVRGIWNSRPTDAPEAVNGLGMAGIFTDNDDGLLWGHNGLDGVICKDYAIAGTGDVQQLNRFWYAEASEPATDTVFTVNPAYSGAPGLSGAAPGHYGLLYNAATGTGVYSVVTNGSARTGTDVIFSNLTVDTGFYTLAARGPLETAPAADIQPLSATLRGTVWGWAGTVTNILFEYGTNTDFGLTNYAEPFYYDGSGACSVSGHVANLAPGITYHYRLTVMVSNMLMQGASHSFTTGMLKVETGAATNIALWSCTLQGIVNPDGERATNILFEYGLVSNALSHSVDAVPHAVSSTVDTAVSATADVLAAGTRHYYRLSVMFGSQITKGDIRFFDAPMTNPTATAAANHTYNTFDAAWQGVPGATNYLLDVSLTNTFATFKPGYENCATGTNTLWTVTDINEGVMYYYRVSAQFPNGASGESDTMAVMHPVSPVHYASPAGSGQWPYTNWANAATQLEQVLRIAVTGDAVHAAAGRYDTGGRVGLYGLTNRAYLRQGISLIGSGPGISFIVGAPDPATTLGPAAVRCVCLEQGTRLTGFTLTNGYTLADATYDADGGGIAHFYYGTVSIVSNCHITGCHASDEGGGIYGNQYLACRNCTIDGNRAETGGGAYNIEGYQCIFRQNRATNGGAAANATLYGCNMVSNRADASGGGAYDCTVHDASVSFNEATSGGGLCDCNASNCVILANSASEGGGIFNSWTIQCNIQSNVAYNSGGGASSSYVEYGRLTANTANDFGGGIYQGWTRGCLLMDNEAVLRGGGAYGAEIICSTVISNSAYQGGGCYSTTSDSCIVIGNSATSGSNWLDGTFSYSCTQPLPPGTGNSAARPLFAAPFDGRLTDSSPCIDAGRSTNLVSFTYDLFHTQRPLDGNNDGLARTDMGCHEFIHPEADTDGDTMLDAWETVNHLHPVNPADAPLDYDNDGDSCAVEHIADTDPWDSNAWFRVAGAAADPATCLEFVSSTGRLYTLSGNSNLVKGAWQHVTGAGPRAGNGGPDSLTDTNVPRQGPFYRLKVTLP